MHQHFEKYSYLLSIRETYPDIHQSYTVSVCEVQSWSQLAWLIIKMEAGGKSYPDPIQN